MTFILVKENFVQPFEVEYVAQNDEENKELIAKFSIKHVNDWPEKAVEDYVHLQTKWQQLDSLLKKQKKKMDAKQAEESFRINAAFNRLIGNFGLVEEEAVSVWNSLSFPMKAKITEAYIKWGAEKSKEMTK